MIKAQLALLLKEKQNVAGETAPPPENDKRASERKRHTCLQRKGRELTKSMLHQLKLLEKR